MAYTSVDHARHRADNAIVKPESGIDEQPRRWRFGRRAQQPARPVQRVEHSDYPRPDAPTQLLPPVGHQSPASPAARPFTAPPRPLPGARLDDVALNMIDRLTEGMRGKVSATALLDLLDPHIVELHKRANREQEGAQRLLGRAGNGKAAADRALEAIQATVAAQEAAERTPGVTVDARVDTGALAKGIVAVTANQGDLGSETTQFEALTPERLKELDAAQPQPAQASPVHTDDGVAPPVPAAEDDSTPFEVQAVRGQIVNGIETDASDIPRLLESGRFWLAHKGKWHLIRGAERVDGQVHVALTHAATDCPDADARVHVLSDADARVLRGMAAAR